jgi:SAM-dependent methyltransferase
MIWKLIRNLGRSLALAWHALWSPRLMYRRYVARKPVVGAVPGEQLAHEMFWERRFRTHTGGWDSIKGPAASDSVGYEGTPYLLLVEVFRHLKLRMNDVFVDVGCGKGRVLRMALQSTVGVAVGVELDDGFLKAARGNLQGSGSEPDRYDLFHGPVQDFNFDSATVLFLFNPFGAKTMREMLDRVAASLRRRPREVRIVYVNPVEEAVLAETPWLRRTEVWLRNAWPDNCFRPERPHVVSFWSSRNAAVA